MTEFRAQISTIRSLVQQRLSGLSETGGAPEQAYLFRGNEFVGVRFRLGGHRSDWIFGQPVLTFFQNDQPVVNLFLSIDHLDGFDQGPATLPLLPLTSPKVAADEPQRKAA